MRAHSILWGSSCYTGLCLQSRSARQSCLRPRCSVPVPCTRKVLRPQSLTVLLNLLALNSQSLAVPPLRLGLQSQSLS